MWSLRCMLEEEQMGDDIKEEVNEAMESMTWSPGVTFQKSGCLRHVLGCLSFRELHNISVYLRRHGSEAAFMVDLPQYHKLDLVRCLE